MTYGRDRMKTKTKITTNLMIKLSQKRKQKKFVLIKIGAEDNSMEILIVNVKNVNLIHVKFRKNKY